ncbi:YfiT family bacillithiol transferase [Sediminibacterium ginsengisoli]|uniref:DinB superfamily protein n=1 Tax=Sediminibacterium ginsengisoli TaxID=413434 RepID=A0A1T4P4L9_9BACT|nr:putative metal-dependent hydrolase [Sediminibacterium ginsengisoli]SJZ86372.1 DinB superfamily protein [Sediminibacterium ginsengisoli]
MSSDPRYPIGQYEPQPFSEKQKKEWLLDLRFLPEELERSILNLDSAQLQTPYREGGWTVQQVVHHVADSHINAYTRFKLGLTEDKPVIKPYEEKEWALLPDNDSIPVNVSLTLLYALHQRLVATLQDLTGEQWQRSIVHPEHGKEMTLWHLLGMYAWHGRHHTAHITSLREQRGW